MPITCNSQLFKDNGSDSAITDLGRRTRLVTVPSRTVYYYGYEPNNQTKISLNDNSTNNSEGWKVLNGTWTGKSSVFTTDPLNSDLARSLNTELSPRTTRLVGKIENSKASSNSAAKAYAVTVVTKDSQPSQATLYFCNSEGNPRTNQFECKAGAANNKACTVVFNNNNDVVTYTVRDYQTGDDSVGP